MNGHPSVRLSELLAALSLGIDLGFGQPMEHALRQCLIALGTAERLGLDGDARGVVYYTALLINVGCHADAHEQAKWFGDDIALKSTKYEHDLRSARSAVQAMRRIGSGNPPLHRFRIGLEYALYGHREVDRMIQSHAAMARALAEQLELPFEVADAVGAAYERWDGKGWPGERAGEQVPVAAMLAQLGEWVEVVHRIGGAHAAREMVRDRRGAQFSPVVADAFIGDAEQILATLDDVDAWSSVIEAEPALSTPLTEAGFDAALLAIADFADLKSPYLMGHARAVAGLATQAGLALGMKPADADTLRRAALVQDLGRLGVSNAILDKRGPLGAGEWERIRLHPYLTTRMLQQSPALARLGALASHHHERLDGSGYPNGLSGNALHRPGRILAAADAYRAMLEERPYRPAAEPEDAARALRAEVDAGRLDGDVVEAVLSVSGHRPARRAAGPAGLTAREVEVLTLVARGLSTKEIARRLVIAPKTAGNHIEHIYAKIGASNRAMASMFALRNGLIEAEPIGGTLRTP